MRAFFLLFTLTACGTSKGTSPASSTPNPSPSAYAVASVDMLPPCDASHHAQLLYIEGEKRFVVCHEPNWVTIDLKGDTGAAGKDANADGMFAASIHCGGQLASTTVYFTYDAALTKGGDVFADGAINDGNFEVSNTQFYSKDQNGATTAMVTLQYDLQGAANAGWFSLELNRSTLVTTIVYHDSDAAGGQTVWSMTPDQCVSNTYP